MAESFDAPVAAKELDDMAFACLHQSSMFVIEMRECEAKLREKAAKLDQDKAHAIGLLYEHAPAPNGLGRTINFLDDTPIITGFTYSVVNPAGNPYYNKYTVNLSKDATTPKWGLNGK